MSTQRTPALLHRRARQREIVEVVENTQHTDTAVCEIVERTDESTSTVRDLLRDLRDRGELSVTRRVGSAKLHATPEVSSRLEQARTADGDADSVFEAIDRIPFSDCSVVEVARLLDISDGSARRKLRELRDSGDLCRVRVVGNANLYRLSE